MDEIEDFFNISKDFVPRTAPVERPRDEVASTSKTALELLKRHAPIFPEDCKTLKKLRRHDDCKETNEKLHRSNQDPEVANFSIDDLGEETEPVKVDGGIYERYVFDLSRDSSLPIYDAKEKIIDAIRKNPVVILEGDTGCGKTTQVPQYILDEAYRRREYCRIICTQPRRIAAMSIAKRVCSERKWEEGSVVGYQVGLHANISDDTHLLYCTTGVLLQKLIREKTLFPYTHVILDEVHERDQDMDFLLIIVRRLLVTNSKNVKIILMSATMDVREFSQYFKIFNRPAPVIHSDARRLYQVKEFYLSDLDRINTKKATVDFENPGIDVEMYNLALKLIIVIDSIEKKEADFNPDSSMDANRIAILIFLPGINEIDQMYKRLEQLNDADLNKSKLSPIRLHSIISPEEQVKIFHRPPPGYRKVILATNIAESSITVPDIKYVIDFCLTKILITDTSTNFTTLQLHWASRANCRQRAGRAGRVMNGRVYRLLPRHYYEKYLDEFSTPEMLRCPLENVVLKAKLLEMGSPSTVLGLSMNPPNLSDIQNTITILKEVGALYKYANDIYSIEDGDISFMGRVMALMPLDVRLTRLTILGWVFGALEESIIIAAGLSVRSIFKTQHYKRQNQISAFVQKLKWADGSGSDLIAILNAYKQWSSLSESDEGRDENDELSWAGRNFVNIRSIREMHLLVIELKERLAAFGIKKNPTYRIISSSLDWEKAMILKIIISGAFYPNYFTRSRITRPEKERSIYHTLCGHDPCNTVMFSNFEARHIGELYTGRIKELFKDVDIEPEKIDVHFQSGSEKVFIVFKDRIIGGNDNEDDQIKTPGLVDVNVYKALRLRSLSIRHQINVMNSKEGEYAERYGLGNMCDGTFKPTDRHIQNVELVVLPSVFQKNITGYITHIETCSKFYFQPISEMPRLREIDELLNDPNELQKCRFSNAAEIKNGMFLSAHFEEKFHRAKVLNVIHVSRQHTQFKVHFIDFGNKSIVKLDDLRRFSNYSKHLADIPPRLFQCRLALVEASAVLSPTEKWVDEAMVLMQEHADAGPTEIEVYSLIKGVANVIVKKEDSSLNETLVEKGLARNSDENLMSKTDHDFRLRKQSVANRFLDDEHSRQNEDYLRSLHPELDVNIQPPPKQLCTRTLHLRGPFSPIETNIYSATSVGNCKAVQAERDSVNFMLIDPDPKDAYERLTVAAGITESPNGDNLVIRGTTLMPNIHGFCALMTLLFCPTMQLKCNKEHTKYVSIIAGLGCDEETFESLYKEHDIVLNLDVDLLPDDIELINQIRYSMDTILFTKPNQERPAIHQKECEKLTAKIQKLIFRLLSKNRKYTDVTGGPNDNKWQKLAEETITDSTDLYGKRSLFPPLLAPRLYDEKYDRIHSLTSHCEELHRLRQFDGNINSTTCLLCQESLENITHLRIHLLSQQHRDREHQIRFKAPAI
ncbi:putative ATP-dependent RNA helicase spindle-E isoform 1-T2 [Glossina fuscipes fuscipes]